MKIDLTKAAEIVHIDTDLSNIISINNADESEIVDEDLMDFDFDYDPNEMYYALLNKD